MRIFFREDFLEFGAIRDMCVNERIRDRVDSLGRNFYFSIVF